MAQAVLEIRDGLAVGVIHRPMTPHALTDISLESKTACGLTGYVYTLEGLIGLRFPTCSECRMAVGRRHRVPVDRSARPCEECGHDFEPRPGAPVSMRFCCKKCRQRAYYKANLDHLRAYHRDWMREYRSTQKKEAA